MREAKGDSGNRQQLPPAILSVDRRSLLKASVLGIGATVMQKVSTVMGDSAAPSQSIVETTAGKVRGRIVNRVHIFKGIPYGASTAGKNRFMPPVKPDPWAGVHDTLEYGHSAPQTIPGAPGILAGADFLSSGSNPAGIGEGEDCLVLNIWAPSVKGNHKRPVMVWCHGGAFTSGSGSAPLVDGTNLARRGDVVVVTINHRLGLLGYTYLGHASDAFKASGNVGMLDIVAALAWVRDNIANFGGDPGRILVFGQSGGGQKVSTILAMPPAKGLFHRAIIESGPGVKMNSLDYATKVGDMVLAELGIKQLTGITDIQSLPLDRIMAAQGAVNRKLGGFIPGMIAGFSPVVDGVSLLQNPFDPVAPEISADVPVLIGFNRTELTLFAASDPSAFSLDEAGLHQRIQSLLGDRAEAAIQAFRSDYPNENSTGLYFLIASAYPTLAFSVKIAERRAVLGNAPTFVYEFTWETPILKGRLRSPHTIEIPFVFDNVSDPLVQKLTGSAPDIFPLAERVSGAWAAFAATGSPNSKGFPRWSTYSAADRNVMMINSTSEVVKDPARQSREVIENILFPA